MALTYSQEKMIGVQAPSFNLPGVDHKNYSLENLLKGKHGVVVMFICNHCPYVKAYFDRLIALAREYTPKGLPFVGINSNDDINYPDDSFENMITLAKRKEFPFPYVRDQDQTVARAYDAVCTPEVFIVDHQGIIRYHGGIDDSWNDETKIQQRYLKNAIEDVMAKRQVKTPTPHALGCSIKWNA